MPDSAARRTRGERVGCGCFLIGIGAGATFVGLIWAMDGLWGESGTLAEALLYAGLGAVVLGVLLFGLSLREPD